MILTIEDKKTNPAPVVLSKVKTATRARSGSCTSARCTPNASFSQLWVCDCCGTSKFDLDSVQEGMLYCEHEERSLYFVDTT